MRATLEAPSWECRRFAKTFSGNWLLTNTIDKYPPTGIQHAWLCTVLALPQPSFLFPVTDLRAEICTQKSWDYSFPK